MNCKNCGKIISDFMNFCPYCGHLEGKTVSINNIAKDKENIETLFQEERYDEILEYAIQGSNIAKSYYINYVISMADEPQWTDDEDFKNNLKKRKNSLFPTTALGVYLFYHGKKGFLGITDDASIDNGRNLIQQNARNDEPAAMTIFAKWLLHGEGVDKDAFSAYRMMKAAAEKDYPPAIYQLGTWHYDGIEGISKNEEHGYELVEKAAFLGDVSAYEMIAKKHTGWFEESLGIAISTESLADIFKMITHQIQYNSNEECVDWKIEYDKCMCSNDFVALYKKIKKANAEKNLNLLIWLRLLLSNLLDLPLNDTNVENVLKIKADTEKALRLVEQYTCPQHFLHFKDDLKKLRLKFDDEIMERLMGDVSLILRSKCKRQASTYVSYLKSREEDKKAKDTKGGFIGGIIISIIVGIFFLPAGIILGVLFVLGKLLYMKDQLNFKKISNSSRNDYLLINSLIGYGYSPLEPWMIDEIKYYVGDEYQNEVPSILQQNSEFCAKYSAKQESEKT